MKRISIFVSLLYIVVLCVPVSAQELFRQEGIGSWYGPGFDGRPTASGETFDSSQFTAAHPDLPFGTMLLVTNKHNNRQVTVRVNDRGPFVAARIVDVSKAAAEHLDMIITGTAPVVIETLQGGYSAVTPTVTPIAPPAAPTYLEAPVYTQPVYTLPIYPETPAYTQTPPAYSSPVYPEVPAYTYTPLPPALSIVESYSYDLPPPATPDLGAAPLAYAAPEPALAAFAPELAPPATPAPTARGVKFIPAIEPQADKTYKLQVGSYKDPRSAVAAFEKLRNVGLGPSYERYGDFYRVVLAGVRGDEVKSVADKLDTVGFYEALIREDR